MLTSRGIIELENWFNSIEKEYKDTLLKYRTSFNPKDFTQVYTVIEEQLLLRRIPNTTKLNIVFMMTGEQPYPEMLTLMNLHRLGYTFNRIIFFDRLYTRNSPSLKKIQDILEQCVDLEKIKDIIFIAKPNTMMSSLRDIHIYTGFNTQLLLGISAEPDALELRLFQDEIINMYSMFNILRIDYPNRVEVVGVSYDDGRLKIITDHIEGSLKLYLEYMKKLEIIT